VRKAIPDFKNLSMESIVFIVSTQVAPGILNLIIQPKYTPKYVVGKEKDPCIWGSLAHPEGVEPPTC
jgi:hypothetical protein